MKVYTLSRKQIIHAKMKECWDFFSNPRNLSRITPASLDFRVLSELPERVYAGMMIRYRVKPLFGIPVTWVTEITHVREEEYFSDEQRVGPYALWHHEHFFRKIDDGRVEVGDLVHYALPFGIFGTLAHPLLVKRELGKIFSFREKAVADFFGK